MVKPSKSAVLYSRRSGNNWYRVKTGEVPNIEIQENKIPVLSKEKSYKYLGKSVSLVGEDYNQINEMVKEYTELIDKIKVSKLPVNLKINAINNMALSKILHNFYNSRIKEEDLIYMDKHLVEAVREMYGLFKSTTQAVIFIPREEGGLGVRKISYTYYSTRISFLIKMLNHSVEQFQMQARLSLELDMKKRGVKISGEEETFLGYELNDKGYLKCNTKFGCQSDWPDLTRYCRISGTKLIFENNVAKVIINGERVDYSPTLQKQIYKCFINKELEKSNELSLQGSFLGLKNILIKSSHSLLYNWSVNDELVKFTVKARLNILPTNFTTHIWNPENNPLCPFGCEHTESIAHLLNGCFPTFKNYYSRRHNRIMNKISEYICNTRNDITVYIDKFSDTIFPNIKEQLIRIEHRRPDIIVLHNRHQVNIIEVTVCYDLYLDTAYDAKVTKYQELIGCLRKNGLEANLHVICFGSLGCIRKNAWNILKTFNEDKTTIKELLKWCSISAVIGSNYIWRHRIKKLTG